MDTPDIISFDLDETLIYTQQDYDNARQQFAEWIKTEFSVETDLERIQETQQRYSRELYDEYGVSLERFPKACEEAYRELVGDENQTNIEKAREIGAGAFLSKDGYRKRGFVDGAEQALDAAAENADLVLVTQGIESLQWKKIQALQLDRWFDNSIYVVDEKKEKLEELRDKHSDSTIYHVGNSWRSDVEPALEVGLTPVYVPEGEWRGEKEKDLDNVILLDDIKELAEML